MASILRTTLVILVIVLVLTATCDGKRKKDKQIKSKLQSKQAKQSASELELRETNPPNFLRLLVMRLIYGIAAQMNMEERVAGLFNGAFAPPNADYDDLGFGGLGDLGAEDLFDA